MNHLPTELLVKIFSFLDGWELLVLEQVCDDWKEVIRKWIWPCRRGIALTDIDPLPHREPFRNLAYDDANAPIPVYSEEDTQNWIHNLAEIGSRMTTVDRYSVVRPQFALREGYPRLSGGGMDWGEPAHAERSRELHSQALTMLFDKRSPSFEYSWEQLDSLDESGISEVQALVCEYPPSPSRWSPDDKRACVFHPSSRLRKLRISNPRSCWGDVSFDLLGYVSYILDVCPQIATVEFNSVLVSLERNVDILVHLACPTFTRNEVKRLMKCFNATHDDSDESDEESRHILSELMLSRRVRSVTIDTWNTAPWLQPQYLIRVLENPSLPAASTEALLRTVLTDMTEELFLSDASVRLLALLRDTGTLRRLQRLAIAMNRDSSPIDVMDLLLSEGCLQRTQVLAIHLNSDGPPPPLAALNPIPTATQKKLPLRQLMAKGHISLPHLISIMEQAPRLQQLVIELPSCEALSSLRQLLKDVAQMSELRHLSISVTSPFFRWSKCRPLNADVSASAARTNLLTLQYCEDLDRNLGLRHSLMKMVPQELVGRIIRVMHDGSTTEEHTAAP